MIIKIEWQLAKESLDYRFRQSFGFCFKNMRWLLQEGPDAKKHKQRAHPVVTFVIHYTVLITTTFYAHDVLVERASRSLQEDCTISEELLKRRQWVGPVLGLYFCMYFAIRLALQWNSKPYLFNVVFYESTFMCSATIVCSALSFCFHRPLISQAFCITVGIDQLLWWVSVMADPLSCCSLLLPFYSCILISMIEFPDFVLSSQMHRYFDILGYIFM